MGENPNGRFCVIRGPGERGDGCTRPVVESAPFDLCAKHLLEAYEHVAGEVGVTDVLPVPCPACASRLGVRYPSGWLCAVCEWRLGERPDQEGAPVRVDVVYYLRWRDRVKIGTSSNPRGRLAQLRFDEVLAFERGDRMLEHHRHVQFAVHRLGGEWFDLAEPIVEHVRLLADGVGDPWDLHRRWRSEAAALAKDARGVFVN